MIPVITLLNGSLGSNPKLPATPATSPRASINAKKKTDPLTTQQCCCLYSEMDIGKRFANILISVSCKPNQWPKIAETVYVNSATEQHGTLPARHRWLLASPVIPPPLGKTSVAISR